MSYKLDTGTHVKVYVSLEGGELDFEVSYDDRWIARQAIQFSINPEELKSVIKKLENSNDKD